MLRRSFTLAQRRSFRTSAAQATKVAGGIGQPLSLLLKNSPQVSHLALFDIVNTPGVAADLSHISSPAKVSSGVGNEELGSVLDGCEIVVIPAGVPRKPGMTRDQLFETNASIVYQLAEAAAKHCPKAHMLIIANPVNSTVPIVAEAFKKAGVYDARRLFGVTTLDVTRAKTFIAEAKLPGENPANVDVTVIGGHAGKTILPLLSSVKNVEFTDEERDALTHRIQFGGDEVVQAKAGAGSATLSMAYAGAHFTQRLLDAINGEKNVVECTFVEQPTGADSEFFAYPTTLGPNGVEKIHSDVSLNAYEKSIYDEMIGELKGSIAKGQGFAASK